MADHAGSAYDSFSGYAHSANAKQFCSDYGVNRSASFAISKFTEPHAFALVQFWITKMQYLLEVWLAKGIHHVFVRADVAAFVEPDDIAPLDVGGGVVYERIQEIRDFLP